MFLRFLAPTAPYISGLIWPIHQLYEGVFGLDTTGDVTFTGIFATGWGLVYS